MLLSRHGVLNIKTHHFVERKSGFKTHRIILSVHVISNTKQDFDEDNVFFSIHLFIHMFFLSLYFVLKRKIEFFHSFCGRSCPLYRAVSSFSISGGLFSPPFCSKSLWKGRRMTHWRDTDWLAYKESSWKTEKYDRFSTYCPSAWILVRHECPHFLLPLKDIFLDLLVISCRDKVSSFLENLPPTRLCFICFTSRS